MLIFKSLPTNKTSDNARRECRVTVNPTLKPWAYYSAQNGSEFRFRDRCFFSVVEVFHEGGLGSKVETIMVCTRLHKRFFLDTTLSCRFIYQERLYLYVFVISIFILDTIGVASYQEKLYVDLRRRSDHKQLES